jgi:hypothetical protein
MKKLICTFLFIISWFALCTAQSTNDSAPIFTDWGESVHGVHLAVTLSNNVVVVGSRVPVFIKMENLSTNDVYMGESTPEKDFSIILTSGSGKIYRLTPIAIVFSHTFRAKLDPGENRNWIITVELDKYFAPPGLVATHANIEPGEYMLKATRKFILARDAHDLNSNLIKLQIK